VTAEVAAAGPSDRAPGPAAIRGLVPVLVAVTAVVAVLSSLGAPLIPTIAASDHVPLSSAQWVLTIGLLAGAVTTPVLGRLADGPRQRQVVLVTLTVGLVGCGVAALSTNFTTLIVGRALQGTGLGMLPVTMAIARLHLPPGKAARAVVALSITTAVGTGLGYPATSVIAEFFDFHAAFWFGAIAIGLALVAAFAIVPAPPRGPDRRFDWIGVLGLGLPVTALLVVLSEGTAWGWASARSLGLLGGGVLLLAGWVPYELNRDDPLVDLRQVRHRSVLTADVSGLLMASAMYLYIPLVVELIQLPASTGYGFGKSITVAGLVQVPQAIGSFVTSRFVAGLDRRFGPRALLPVGSLIFAAVMVLVATGHTQLWEMFVVLGVSGIGVGLTFGAMPGLIVRAVPKSATGSATGFYIVVRSIGLAVGSAIAAAVLAANTPHGQSLPTFSGFRDALLIGAGLCAATAVISWTLPGPVRPLRTRTAGLDPDERLAAEEIELGGTEV
jgi:MFS family permease